MSVTAQRAYDQYFGENKRYVNRFTSEYINGGDAREYLDKSTAQKDSPGVVIGVASFSGSARRHLKSHIAEDISCNALYDRSLLEAGHIFAAFGPGASKTFVGNASANPFVFFMAKRAAKAKSNTRVRPHVIAREVQPEALEAVFNSLVDTWKKETEFSSSLSDIIMHPAYQRIIGLGPKVTPLVLRHLEVNGGHLFAALQALTGENPVKDEDSGRVRRMRESWLEWGRQNKLI